MKTANGFTQHHFSSGSHVSRLVSSNKSGARKLGLPSTTFSTKSGAGFTLIELIIVVAIIGLLAAALYVALDPAGRIGRSRDARRYTDVSAILNAILEYTADTTTLPTNVAALNTDVYYVVQNGSNGQVTAETSIPCNETGIRNGVILGSQLVSKYISTIPQDPRITTATSSSQYYIRKTTNDRITIGACEHYQSGSVEVQR